MVDFKTQARNIHHEPVAWQKLKCLNKTRQNKNKQTNKTYNPHHDGAMSKGHRTQWPKLEQF